MIEYYNNEKKPTPLYAGSSFSEDVLIFTETKNIYKGYYCFDSKEWFYYVENGHEAFELFNVNFVWFNIPYLSLDINFENGGFFV